MTAAFITGTGTEIGKTFVVAALIHEFRRRGRKVTALNRWRAASIRHALPKAIPAFCSPR